MAGENIHYLNEAPKADLWIEASNFTILVSSQTPTPTLCIHIPYTLLFYFANFM